jgi:hypothetical protein
MKFYETAVGIFTAPKNFREQKAGKEREKIKRKK